MAIDQLISNFLVALTLVLAAVLVRLIAFARLNRRLRHALRERPEDVPTLAAGIRFRAWIYDLWSLSVLAAAAALAFLASKASVDDPRPLVEMAIVSGVSGLVLLAYIQLQRRRHRRRVGS